MVVIARLVGILCVSFLLFSCHSPTTEALRFGLQTAPTTLDPRFATDAVSSRLVRLIYQPLIDFDEQSRPVPVIADWQQLSETLFRFELIKEAQFHHGKKVTAQDVWATYNSVLNNKPASPFRAQLASIDSITVINDRVIEFKLKQRDNLFISRMNIPIMPGDLINSRHDFSTQPVGSGNFKLGSWEAQGVLTLQRVADGRRISFIEVKNPTVRVLKLLNNEIDIIQNDITPELVRHLEQQKAINVSSANGSNFSYIGFNMQDELVGVRQIRRALAMAIDRQAIIHFILNDHARQASSVLVPEHWAGHDGLETLPYDPLKAKQLLEGLGYHTDRPLNLVYKTSSNPLRVRIATIIQSQLKNIGVAVKIQSHDWGTFYGDIKAGNFQMYSLSWVAIKSPDIFENVFHSKLTPPRGANRGRYNNSRVDTWISQSQHVASTSEQQNMYKKIQQQVLEDLPYIPLWYEDHIVAHQKHVSGYRLQSDGNYDSLATVRWRQ